MSELKPNSEQVRFLEELSANGHVALNTLQYDGWLLRFSNGHTARANSVSVLYPSAKDPEEKIAYCEACYAKQGLPTIFKLTDCDTELYDILIRHGYETVSPTDVMILDLEGTEPAQDLSDCVFSPEPSEWLPDYFAFEGLTDRSRQDTYRAMLSRVLVEPIYCTVFKDGRAAACASAVLDQGYMLLHNVVVDPARRGAGLGEKLCRAIIEKGRTQGARHVFLQVVQKNGVARHLYQKLGFRKLYTYRYLRKSSVRFGERGDIDRWMELVRSVRSGFPGLETESALDEHRQTVEKFMDKRQALCVKSGGSVLGVLLFSRSRNMICCLAVSPEHRRKRIASTLLEKALGELDRTRDITVSTFREGDEKGIAPRALYRKFGFREGELTVEFGYPNQVFTLRGESREER